MLDSRILSVTSSRQQPVHSSLYSTRIKVYRKKLDPVKDAFSGDFGENPVKYELVTRGWPAVICSQTSELVFIPPGQTERGDYLLICPYKKMRDGKLLVRERDIIVDTSEGNTMLVLWSYDPSNLHTQIIAVLRFGVTNVNLEEQG